MTETETKPLTNRQRERRDRLAPNGVPRWVRCYDNGGIDSGQCSVEDRYTVVFTGRYHSRYGGKPHRYAYRGMSANPTHPQGVGTWGDHDQIIDTIPNNGPGGELRRGSYVWPPAIGRKCHLGYRIKFTDLPEACQKLIKSDYAELWDIQL